MNEDIYDTIFKKYAKLLHEDIEKLNIRGVMNYWEISQTLGVRGQVLRMVITEEAPDMIRRLIKGYKYLGMWAGDKSYEDLVKVWRLRKLAKATLKGKEEKLRKLLAQEEYKSIYWLLNYGFNANIKSENALVLYVYFYVLTSPQYQIDIEKITREYPRYQITTYNKDSVAKLAEKIRNKLRDQPAITLA